MIRVSNHEEFQTAVFDESSYSQIRYQAISTTLFTVPILNEIVGALGGEPVQMFPENTTEKLFLLNEIEAAVNRKKWDFTKDYFLVVGTGNGQLLHGLRQTNPGDLEDQEEKARYLIGKYTRLLCVIDTDIASMMPMRDSGLEPSGIPNQTADPRGGRTTNEDLELLKETVKNLKQELTSVREAKEALAERIQHQKILFDQTRQEYEALQRQVAAGNRNPEDLTSQDEQYDHDFDEDYADQNRTLGPQGSLSPDHLLASNDWTRSGTTRYRPPDSDEEISSIQSYQKSPFLDDETCSNIMPKRRKPLETPPHQDGSVIPVWRRLSSEVNQMERGTVQRPRRYKAWTLKTLNIQKYDPEQMDIITHVERVTRILEEVNVKPESQKIRLLLASLPSTMDHYEKAVPNRHRNDYTRFSRELVKIMGNKIRVASERFIQCHRKRGEDILRFFFRLCDLYKSSKGLMGDEWQKNPTHVSQIYSLLYQGVYNEEQLWLDEKLDKQLEKGILTVARLKTELIEINKRASNKIKSEVPNPNSILTVEALNISSNDEERDVNVERLDHDIEEEFYYND